jgi:hypothetical protein
LTWSEWVNCHQALLVFLLIFFILVKLLLINEVLLLLLLLIISLNLVQSTLAGELGCLNTLGWGGSFFDCCFCGSCLCLVDELFVVNDLSANINLSLSGRLMNGFVSHSFKSANNSGESGLDFL